MRLPLIRSLGPMWVCKPAIQSTFSLVWLTGFSPPA